VLRDNPYLALFLKRLALSLTLLALISLFTHC
jgi:hypothetical protein